MKLTRFRSSHVSQAAIGCVAGLAFVGFSAAPAAASSGASCSEPVLSQPFLSYGDSNHYMEVPGQNANSFNGEGWTLSGGAKVEAVSQAGGKSASVLNLPSGSKAVSPTVCVTSEYPVARMMVRNVVGAEGVSFNVSYAGTASWEHPKNTGQVHGTGTEWTLSAPVNLQPEKLSGWQQVKFTLIPGGTSSDFQVYDFYVDPFCRH